MSFNRHIKKSLISWQNKDDRKPLLVRGARQVGKTTLIKEFAKSFQYSIILNLERPNDVKYFEDYDTVEAIMDALFLNYNIPKSKLENTLLFIDEIQESPKAIALLRYFYEDLPQLYVIAAGSLLEHVMHKVKSFPVGRVEYLYVHPLNFSEFLYANGTNLAADELNQIPVKITAHKVLKDLFHQYAIVGGMPAVLKKYLQANSSVADLPSIYQSIWATYKDDVEKYAETTTEARVIKHVIDTAHLFVDQRIKFQNFGNSNYKSREVGEALRNLNDAKIIQLVYPTTQTEPPVIPDLKKSPRLQFLDTGLLNHELRIQGDMLAFDDLNLAYKGAIIPHLITQELMSLQIGDYKKPSFWVRQKTQSQSEIDLVLPYKNKLIPIEIKSGKEGKLKSLHQFMETVDHPYAVRIFAGQFSVEQHQTPTHKKPYLLMNLPYYLGTKINEYLAYFIDNYKLDH